MAKKRRPTNRKPHERRPPPRRIIRGQNADFTDPNAGVVHRETANLIKNPDAVYKVNRNQYIIGHDPEKSAAYWAPKFRRSAGQKRRAKTTGKPIDWSGQGLGRRKR